MERRAYQWPLTLLLTLACLLVIYYTHFVAQQEMVLIHLLYLPIAVVSVWWERRGVVVPLILAGALWVAHAYSNVGYPIQDDLLMGGAFVTVGLTLGTVSARSHAFYRLAIEEKQRRLGQMDQHLRYMNEVAHELRNPLQVCLGAVGLIGDRGLSPEAGQLVGLIERNSVRMAEKIRELTANDHTH